MFRWCTITVAFIILLGTQNVFSQQEVSLLDSLISHSEFDLLKKIVSEADKYRVQIFLTEVNGDSLKPELSTWQFRYRPDEYFYPASLVKLPMCAFALERLNEPSFTNISKYSPFRPANNFKCSKDTGYLKKLPYYSIEDCIRKIFAVSDNAAFNYLYEFVGPEYANKRLKQMGFRKSAITHRLSGCDTIQHHITGPVEFIDTNNHVILRTARDTSKDHYRNSCPDPFVGKAHILHGKRINAPYDFTHSSFISLYSLHEMLIGIMFPLALPENRRFQLNENELFFLRTAMCVYPRNSGFKEYSDEDKYYDSMMKYYFSSYGRKPIEDHIKIFNKVGMAYGFLSDCSYVYNSQTHKGYFISAVIYCNENEIINDGKYEYSEIGFPFFAELNKVIERYIADK